MFDEDCMIEAMEAAIAACEAWPDEQRMESTWVAFLDDWRLDVLLARHHYEEMIGIPSCVHEEHQI